MSQGGGEHGDEQTEARDSGSGGPGERQQHPAGGVHHGDHGGAGGDRG